MNTDHNGKDVAFEIIHHLEGYKQSLRSTLRNIKIKSEIIATQLSSLNDTINRFELNVDDFFGILEKNIREEVTEFYENPSTNSITNAATTENNATKS